MSTSAVATVIPFPTPEKPRTLDEKVRAYLDAKRAAAAAEQLMKELAPEVIAAMKAEGRKGVSVSGVGRVSLVTSEGGSRLDTRAAVAALIDAGLPVPMVETPASTTLRASLD